MFTYPLDKGFLGREGLGHLGEHDEELGGPRSRFHCLCGVGG